MKKIADRHLVTVSEKKRPEKCEGEIATVTTCHTSTPPSELPAEAKNPTGETTFDGPCIVCQLGEHRAAQCPKRMCYFCRQSGHLTRECLMRVVVGGIVCQGCSAAGNVLTLSYRMGPVGPTLFNMLLKTEIK